MPDWKQIVRKNLCVLKACSPEFADKIAEELASHLEDSYEEHLRSGLPEEGALQRILNEIELCRWNWLALRLLKEERMTGFTRKVGLPGLLAFASAMAMEWVLAIAHMHPKTIFLSNGLFLSLPITWMCLLPICGALGAIVSRRNGGSLLDRMIAAAFPAEIASAVLFVVFIVGWVISQFVADSGWNWAFVLPALGLWQTGSALLPAIPLLLGGAAADAANRALARAA